jgi:hypothetical protein
MRSQGGPGGRSQGEPGGAMGSQEERGARRSQEEPGGARRIVIKVLISRWSDQEGARGARGSQEEQETHFLFKQNCRRARLRSIVVQPK